MEKIDFIDLENELRLEYEQWLTSFGRNDFNRAEKNNNDYETRNIERENRHS